MSLEKGDWLPEPCTSSTTILTLELSLHIKTDSNAMILFMEWFF